MREFFRDLPYLIPRWKELSTWTQRATVAAGVAVIVAVALVVAMTVRSADPADTEQDQTVAALPRGGLMVDCARWVTATGEAAQLSIAAAGGATGLPFHANLADASVTDNRGHHVATVSVCMAPDATDEDILDTATATAANIRTGYPRQRDITTLAVEYLGTGAQALKTVQTNWSTTGPMFIPTNNVVKLRDAWTWDTQLIN